MFTQKKSIEVSEIKAFLGKGSEFEGKLNFHETVRIDGHFTGQILSTDTLIIGDSAVVKADISVGKAIISGTVEGNVKATNRLELHPPAKVTGSITAPKLVIMEGVIFDGSCHMGVIEDHVIKEYRQPPLLTRLETVNR